MGAQIEDWSLPLFFPKQPGKCEICGEPHTLEECSLVEGILDNVPDSPTLSYARLTLPKGLEVQEMSDGTKTIVASKSFSKGLKFGPFVAKTSALIDVRIEFPLKVFLSEDESVYLETYEEIFCNWMCLVLPASCAEEQNLMCFQVNTSIYFCSLRNIEEGEELRVWYAPYYAEQMGVQSLPKPPDLVHSSDEEYQEIFDSLQSGVEMQDHQYLPKLKKKRRPPKKLILSENYYREVPPNDVLPGELLGAARRDEWACSTCGQIEMSVAAFARHLMTHHRPPLQPSYRCPHCNRNFKKDTYKRQIHLEICKRKKLNESIKDDTSNQSNMSRMVFIVRTLNSNEASTLELRKDINDDCDLPLDNNLWNKSTVSETTEKYSEGKNNQIINQATASHGKKEILHFGAEQIGEVEASGSKSIDILSNEWSITKQKEMPELITSETLKSVGSYTSTNFKEKIDKLSEQSKNREVIINENPLVKSQLNTPILDLSDDIDFNLTKSLDEMISDDCNLDKAMSFTKNKSLDLFGSVESNLIVHPQNSSMEPSTFYSLERNGFLPPDFASCTDVTDEERNRIVENLLSETDDKFFPSDYEMADGYTSENPELQVKVGEQNKDKGADKKRRSKTGGDFKCEICNKCFTKSFYLYRHLRKHTGEFRCNTCFMVFARKETLLSHRMSCSNEANTQGAVRRVRVLCKFCHLEFYSLKALQQHMEDHYCSGNMWQCKCEMVSDSADLFIKHKCNYKASKSCTKCGKCFKSIEDFVEHKNRPVSRNKKAKPKMLCEFCGLLYKTVTGARLHRHSVHGEKTLICSECGKGYTRKEKLEEHLSVHKQNDVFWECPVCLKKYSQEKNCIAHQKTHCRPAFTCSYCDKQFYQNSNFKKHLKVHEKTNMKCSYCSAEFSSIELLSSHLQEKHADVHKGFECEKCNKIFPVKWQLSKHKRNHSEMYTCTYCGTQIKYKFRLKKHLSTSHKDRVKEWDDPTVLLSMRNQNNPSKKADLTTEEAVDVGTLNPATSNIFQTVSADMKKEDVEVINIRDTQTTMEQLTTNTAFVTAMVDGNMTDGNISQGVTSQCFSVLQGADGSAQQLVDVDGELVSLPLALVTDLSTSPPLATTDEQSSAGAGEGGIISCPLVLPEGFLLTLGNNLVTKQQTEESTTLIDVSDYQAVTGAATSGYVLNDESIAEPNIQLENNVLFYIVDTSLPDVIE